MGKDHTLFTLVKGKVVYTRFARKPLPPQKGRKWIKKPWRKFVNVIEEPAPPKLVLTQTLQPPQRTVT